MATEQKVLIVGAGPVGLTLAWLLTGKGFDVEVFEQQDGITDQLRASTFHPPTLDMFAESGITDELHAKGQVTPTWQIRMHETGERAEFDLGILKDETAFPYRLQSRQANLSHSLYNRLPSGTVHFSKPVLNVGQDADGVWVETEDGRIEGTWLVGCDGPGSIVRKAMDTDYVGEMYPESTILATTHLAFEDYLDGLSGVNYVWHRVGTYSLLRLPDVWRISLHPLPGQTPEEALEDDNILGQIGSIVPDAPAFEIVEKRVYRVQKRVAETYRNGRMLLAGDAAHLNSPKGGMCLNGGVHDTFSLASKLEQIRDGADDSLLDLYVRQRRPIAMEEIIEQADTNRKRMNTNDAEERRQHLERLQRIIADPEACKAFLMRSSMLSGLKRAAAIT